MHRSAPRLSRILACAAVPVMLVVAGCSSDSGDDKKGSDSSASSPSGKKTEPTVEPAKYDTLPADTCKSIARKTTESLVPKAKVKSGTAGKSNNTETRSSCAWNGLDDNGVKGSQYRWLDVGFLRFDSDQALGSGAKRATDEYTKQVAKAQAAEGAKKVSAAPADGIGEQATSVTYDLSKTGEDFEYATVVARTANVVVTLTYNGAGYAGAKTPSAADILKGAQKAAKEAVAAVGAEAPAAEKPSATPSDEASAKTSDKASGKTSSKTSSKAPTKSSTKTSTKS
ncbi:MULTISPECIES: DUF3558 domain-containing protein [Streptomyces]|uniref:DUF3558 domain-containing protein n=1 Tax=Streptomyces clavifer TaxID=68188 RepID=A0ABS4V9W8_9ACTN|nr:MULTISPECIES: DUF3558 domain-containing protein [Streptomyces]MBP2360709.1 hypothetical protein [Streptomyces clavifer]MDX2746115.1 DUF3558 domain-containing protein [Streptomyces sp. NRRL_B-2557]GHB11625.1 hypothetical protein GCM10010392_43920 [Streptomyces clavifer]